MLYTFTPAAVMYCLSAEAVKVVRVAPDSIGLQDLNCKPAKEEQELCQQKDGFDFAKAFNSC